MDMMTQDGRKEFDYFFWEILENEYVINDVDFNEEIPCKSNRLTISRDEDYQIIGSLEGETDIFLFDKKKDGIPGTKVPSITIKGDTDHGTVAYEISRVYINQRGCHSSRCDTSNPKTTFKATMDIGEFKVYYPKMMESKKKKLVEWYINGPRQSYVFTDVAKRNFKKILEVERKPPANSFTLRTESSDGGWSHTFIKLPEYGVIINLIKNIFNPDWSIKIAIEYDTDFGRLPDDDERKAMWELISFILGRRLIKVGQSLYDDHDMLIERIAIPPWGDNVKHLCQHADTPPILIDSLRHFHRFSLLIEELFPQYLNQRDRLKLDEVLWRYWIGSNLPLGSNIPIMATGVEILAKQWGKDVATNTDGEYIDKDLYLCLISSEVESIKKQLDGIQKSSRIINKIEGAYRMGSQEKIDFFFEGIDLKLSRIEEDSFAARNFMIHDAIDLEKTGLERLIKLTYAYKTMFHRIFLKILEYNGTYIDYSTLGFPERNINQTADDLPTVDNIT